MHRIARVQIQCVEAAELVFISMVFFISRQLYVLRRPNREEKNAWTLDTNCNETNTKHQPVPCLLYGTTPKLGHAKLSL